MKLDVKRRLLLVSMLPEQVGSFAEMRTIRDLRADLALSKEEEAAIGFAVNGQRINWDAEKAKEMEQERDFSDTELAILGEVFADLEAKKQIPTDEAFASLYDEIEPHIPSS